MDTKRQELQTEINNIKKRLEDPDIYKSKDYPILAKRYRADSRSIRPKRQDT